MRIKGPVSFVIALAILSPATSSTAQGPLASALSDAWKELPTIPDFNPKYCKESFELHLHDTQKAASSPQLAALKGSVPEALIAQVWTVPENGGTSFYGAIIASSAKAEIVTVVDEESPEHRIDSSLKAKAFESLLDDVMSLPIAEISDIGDGSCTLIMYGPRARMFPPGYGVRKKGGDRLHELLQLFEY